MKNRFRGLSDSRKLEMLQLSVEEIYNQAFLDGHIEGYENGELNERLGYGAIEVVKSPNQQRAELIQRAREFVEGLKKSRTGRVVGGIHKGEIKTYHNAYVIERKIPIEVCSAEFHVKGNKVTCVLKGIASGDFRSVGRAECMPGEVFNEWIGKAIALARALKIEVPVEFLQAVQPTEVVVGMDIHYKKENRFAKVVSGAVDANILTETYFNTARNHKGKVIILDDTNAQYEEESN